MPTFVLHPNNDGASRAKIIGNELRVRPEIYAAMREILNSDGNPDYLAAEALKRAGVLPDEIDAMRFKETCIVVDATITVYPT